MSIPGEMDSLRTPELFSVKGKVAVNTSISYVLFSFYLPLSSRSLSHIFTLYISSFIITLFIVTLSFNTWEIKVITGGSRGIGLMIAKAYVENGAKVG